MQERFRLPFKFRKPPGAEGSMPTALHLLFETTDSCIYIHSFHQLLCHGIQLSRSLGGADLSASALLVSSFAFAHSEMLSPSR